MRKFLYAALALMLGITTASLAANLDDFNGNNLDDMWTYRDPLGNGEYKIEGGVLTMDLKAGSDMYIQGTDGGVCLLTDPPDMEDFTIEMKVNVFLNGFMPPATHIGPLFFNEGSWVYSAWGPYAATDTRLEDCIGGNYRWRADTQIGIDQNVILLDKDIWGKVEKTGNSLEFFAKTNEGDPWVSGGVEATLGENYTPGDYKVGIFFKL